MIWNEDISFEGFEKKKCEWYKGKTFELASPPIQAQYALDLIFKTLIDDKENYPYLTSMSESVEQTNCIMLELILSKYSRKYRKFERKKEIKMSNEGLRSWLIALQILLFIMQLCLGINWLCIPILLITFLVVKSK